MVGEKIFAWWQGQIDRSRALTTATRNIESSWDKDALDKVWAELPAEVKSVDSVKSSYELQKTILGIQENGLEDPFTKYIGGALDDWLTTIKKYEAGDPAKARDNLVALSADVMKLAAGAAVLDYGLGLAPNGLGVVSSSNTKQILAWLGVGAVVTAIAHDPVKIGLLRPYQDSLEATFRNRRPDDQALFQAYKTRELTASKADDLSKLDDTLMDKIEAENQVYYDREIAKWGYSESFAGALARSATRTLNFSQLSALARQGLLTRGMAIYSLWGEGLDRVVMKPALDALLQQNEIASYDGFRAQIERGYTDGLVSEEELKSYYAKLHIPEDVQKIMLPHMKKLREDAKRKTALTAAGPQRDLTVSQVQQAYEAGLLERAKAQNMILSLGYSLDETKILLDLADTRKKLPGASKLKRLPLTDYEKAYKNKLIDQGAVLARMQGEYTTEDIALEKKLLEAGKA